MSRYIIHRVIQAILCVIAVSVIIFLIGRLLGDPTDLLLDIYASDEDKVLLRNRLGLDKPLLEQYGIFIWNALRGSLGESILTKEPVTKLLAERLVATLQLGIGTILIGVAIALPVGIYSAVKRGSFFDVFLCIFLYQVSIF